MYFVSLFDLGKVIFWIDVGVILIFVCKNYLIVDNCRGLLRRNVILFYFKVIVNGCL